MGYLSNAGLSYFFGKLKTIFAPISHGHGGATQSAAGFMSAADKKKLDGIAEGANKYSLPTATSNVLGGVKTGANITNNSGVLSVTAANVTNALGYIPPKQDTNTWRPVVNSLTNSATDQSLSAAQGKVLKGLVDGKAAASHIHSQYYDSTISRTKGTVLAAPASANGVATFRTLTKSDVGLSSVDNTADSAKSVKYATSAGSANTAAKATTADSATTAITSKSLQLLSSVRPTSMNFNLAGTDYLGKITYQIATASTTTGKPPNNSGVLNFSWDNSGWGAQVAVANNNNPRMYVRGAISDNGVSKWDTSWKTVAFTDDKPAAAGTADVANSVDWSKVQNKPATYAPAAHTHTWDSVTGKPSTFTPSSHTHNYAGSSSAGGAATSANKVNAALTINLNGTSQGAWDGSSAKSISITAASVGATSVTISRW